MRHYVAPAARKENGWIQFDQQRFFADMVATSKENVNDIITSVSSMDRELALQDQVRTCVRALLLLEREKSGKGNPAQPPQKGRPKGSDSKGEAHKIFQETEGGKNIMKGANSQAGNPQGRLGGSTWTKRLINSTDRGLGKRKQKKNSTSSSSVP